MNWNQVLDKWEQGIYFTYPKYLKNNKFQWNTSVLSKKGQSKYREKFQVNPVLPLKEDSSAYQEYINNTTEKYVG